MSVASLHLANFKAFKSSGPIPIAPITLLLGRNSSGKSSVAHSLMLLKQSIEVGGPQGPSPQLKLNGTLLEAGTFRDVVYNHRTANEIEAIFECQVPGASKEDGNRSYADFDERPPLVSLDTPRVVRSRQVRRSRYYPRFPVNAKPHRATLSFRFKPEAPFGPSLSGLTANIDRSAEVRLMRTQGEKRTQHWRTYVDGLPKGLLNWEVDSESLVPFLYSSRSQRLQEKRRLTIYARRKLREFLITYGHASAIFRSFIRDLRFLGPFRTPPSRRYDFEGFSAGDTGITGEKAIDLLIMESLLNTADRRYLKKSVGFWLDRLDLASGIDLKPLVKRASLFEAILREAGFARRASIPDVGFGISQVLPVIVQGMLVPRGGTYVVQQPELHLHPDAQAGLADYFIYLASQGIRCLVETHSEYLLIRLRRRLAEKWKPDKVGIPLEEESGMKRFTKSDLRILLVGTSPSGGARVSELEIGDSFQLENMPDGFMDQSLKDRMGILKALGKQ